MKLLDYLQNENVVIRFLKELDDEGVNYETVTTIDVNNTENRSLYALPASNFVKELIAFIKSKDIEHVRLLLPHLAYNITEYPTHNDDTQGKSIRCVSPSGISSEAYWSTFKMRLKEYFGERFLEIYHNVNFNHTDFVIYLKN